MVSKKMVSLTVLLFVTVFSMVSSSNILIVQPFPSTSHALLLEPIVVELAKRGHNVTYVTPYYLNPSQKNVEEIFFNVSLADLCDIPPNLFDMRHLTPIDNIFFLPKPMQNITAELMNVNAFTNLMKSGRKFDALIIEAILFESLAAGLSYTLKTPLIGYAVFMPSYWVNYWVGNEAPTSYIPDLFSVLPYRMNFVQRLMNGVFVVVAQVYQDYFYLRNQDAIMRHHFGAHLPPIKEIIANTSVMLVNDHYSLSFPRPAVPNLINIGGIHVKPPKPLPTELQEYMDNSKNGAILFSLGSILRSSNMGIERIQMFLNVFSKLKQNVLWKFEKDLPNKPSNVLTSPWLPQSDILAHPNLKLFITHGGLLSTTEAVERGIPIIGIPIYTDQPMNIKQSENAGVGLSLQFDLLSEETIMEAIQEILNNPKYNAAAKARSTILKDVESSPKETAVWWVEYVIRHKGARHLRSAAQDLTWYQRQQLDVIATLLIFMATLIFVLKRLTCALCSALKKCGKNYNIGKTKKNS